MGLCLTPSSSKWSSTEHQKLKKKKLTKTIIKYFSKKIIKSALKNVQNLVVLSLPSKLNKTPLSNFNAPDVKSYKIKSLQNDPFIKEKSIIMKKSHQTLTKPNK